MGLHFVIGKREYSIQHFRLSFLAHVPDFADLVFSNSLRQLSAGYVSTIPIYVPVMGAQSTLTLPRSLNGRLNTRRQLRLVHNRMINEMDASAIVRDDLRLHFRTPMTQTMNTVSSLPSPSMMCLFLGRFFLTPVWLILPQIQEDLAHNVSSPIARPSFGTLNKNASVSVAELPVEMDRAMMRRR
jgi:hypothetical protein